MDAFRHENQGFEVTEAKKLRSLKAWHCRFNTRPAWQINRYMLFLIVGFAAALAGTGAILVFAPGPELLVWWYGGKTSNGSWLQYPYPSPPVTQADFSQTSLTDQDLLALSGLRDLQDLDLSETRITDDGLKHLKNFPELRSINLNDTHVTDQGIAHLAECPYLTEIHLARTPITDRALEQLKRIKRIERVNLTGTRTTQAAITELKAQYPTLEIGPFMWRGTDCFIW